MAKALFGSVVELADVPRAIVGRKVELLKGYSEGILPHEKFRFRFLREDLLWQEDEDFKNSSA
jgi:hypothetical protein